MKEIYSEQRDRVKTIVINRPEKLNAFTNDMVHELYMILEGTAADPGTSVVVIKGAGRAFSTGHDLNEITERASGPPPQHAITSEIGEERRRGFEQLHIWYSHLWELPQPVIAQVHGYCYNFALELAMNSDFVIAANDAKFVCRHVGGTARDFHLWPWLIGPRKAKEYAMLGDAVSGEDAERLGMVNRAVPADELDKAVEEFADRLAKIPLELLSLEKKSVNMAMEMLNIKQALSYSMELHAMSHLTEPTRELSNRMREAGWRDAWSVRDSERYGE